MKSTCRKELHPLYESAFFSAIRQAATQEDKQASMKKLALLGVKTMNSRDKPMAHSRVHVKRHLDGINIVIGMMACMTPQEFVRTFPPTKRYDGDRWQMKDYHSTMEAIREIPQDEMIGQHIEALLWDYMNPDVTELTVNLMKATSDMRRLEGKPDLAQAFIDSLPPPAAVYTSMDGRRFSLDGKVGTKKVSTVKKWNPLLVRGGT